MSSVNPQASQHRITTIMSIRNSIAAATFVIATSFASIASANISTGSIGIDVQSAVSDGNVSVVVKDGTATLFGVVESRVDANAAERAASSFTGIDKVINNITVSN